MNHDSEYLATSRINGLAFRLFRHKLILFGIVPVVLFWYCNVFPIRAAELANH